MLPIRRMDGFTLIEAIMAIMITGIVGAMVAVFIKSPIDAYTSAARRAQLTDVADTALRRIGRDIRIALPNSVRNPTNGGDQCLEFMPTKIGGRYRVAQTSTSSGNILDFTAEDGAFDMLWLNSALGTNEIKTGDIVVVYNDGYTGNAYLGTNAIRVKQVANNSSETPPTATITFVDADNSEKPFQLKRLPAESPSYRFQVVPAGAQVVSYACVGNALMRYARTLTSADNSDGWKHPDDCDKMTAGASSSATLASGLTRCSLRYQPPGSGTGAGRQGIVSMILEATRDGEAVQLYHQVNVNNTP